MPFLRDEGPPVSQQTIQQARESLPLEYGFQVVNETGREVLMVRVPKPKPDYLHDLADVAFYVDLDTIRNARDVLLIGHEKTARLEPQLLRDHIRAQQREDESVVADLRRRIPAPYAYSIVQSPSNHLHRAIALRIPKGSVSEFSPDDVVQFRNVLQSTKAAAEQCQYAYIVADKDYERLGRRVLAELLGDAKIEPAPVEEAPPAAPPRALFPPTPNGAPPAAAPAHALPVAVPAPAPVAAPLPPVDIEAHDEYEIVSRPKAAPPPAPSQAPAEAAPEPEYEVMARPTPAQAPPRAEPLPALGQSPAPATEDRQVEKATAEFEVYVSKPKPKADAPAISPPGTAGFQNAFAAGMSAAAAPAKTKEYEIMGRATPVASAPLPRAAPPAPAVRDDPRHVAPRTSIPMPAADSGAPLVARTAPANPEGILAARFREAGYEIVEGLRAQGTVFAFAAHKPNGRRVLVKRAAEFGTDEATTLAQLAVALGADVCLVVADRIAPGTRLATWGTRIEVVEAGDVPALAF